MTPHNLLPDLTLQTSHPITNLPSTPTNPNQPQHVTPRTRTTPPLTTPLTLSSYHVNPYARNNHPSEHPPPTLTETTLDSTTPAPNQSCLHQQLLLYPDGTNDFWGGTIDMNPPTYSPGIIPQCQHHQSI